MKLVILTTTAILAFSLSGRAEVVNLKDGTEIDGEITSEPSGVVLVKTKYGSLTINKSDIAEQQVTKSTAAPNIAAVGLSTASPTPEAPVSTAPFKIRDISIEAQEQDSTMTVTAKVTKLARNELLTFQLNGKYVGKAVLDKNFNVMSQEGYVPDGVVKVYSKEGKPQKEFVFENAAIKKLRVYADGGPLKAEYGYVENRAELLWPGMIHSSAPVTNVGNLDIDYIKPSPTMAFMYSALFPGGGYFYLAENCRPISASKYKAHGTELWVAVQGWN